MERIVPAMTYETEPLRTLTDSNPYPRYALGVDTYVPGRLPGDTVRFAYDVTGGISVASNREAVVCGRSVSQATNAAANFADQAYELGRAFKLW